MLPRFLHKSSYNCDDCVLQIIKYGLDDIPSIYKDVIEQENLSQVNSQLLKWMGTINDKPSTDIIPTSDEKSNTETNRVIDYI